jgi:hypothetical protein
VDRKRVINPDFKHARRLHAADFRSAAIARLYLGEFPEFAVQVRGHWEACVPMQAKQVAQLFIDKAGHAEIAAFLCDGQLDHLSSEFGRWGQPIRYETREQAYAAVMQAMVRRLLDDPSAYVVNEIHYDPVQVR